MRHLILSLLALSGCTSTIKKTTDTPVDFDQERQFNFGSLRDHSFFQKMTASEQKQTLDTLIQRVKKIYPTISFNHIDPSSGSLISGWFEDKKNIRQVHITTQPSLNITVFKQDKRGVSTIDQQETQRLMRGLSDAQN